MLRNLLIAAGALSACYCSATGTEVVAGQPRGALIVDVYPNPVVAVPVGESFEFPFEVSLRETGGLSIDVDAIRVEVRLSGLPIFSQVYDESELVRRGYSAHVPAGGNVQYRFSPRRAIPADLPLSQIAATVAILGTDAAGNQTEAVTIIRARR